MQGIWIPVLCLLLNSVIPAKGDAVCRAVYVYGTINHSRRHGLYTLLPTSEWCHGNPAYRGGKNHLFMSSFNSWFIGSDNCQDEGGLHNFNHENATSPEMLRTPWEEYSYDRVWIKTSTIRVVCAECGVLMVSRSTFNPNHEGIYIKQWGQDCQGRSVYTQLDTTGPSHIYYLERFADPHYSWYNYWLLGSHLCDGEADLSVYDSAGAPEFVRGQWHEQEQAQGGDKWFPTNVEVTCEESRAVNVTGFQHNSEADGVYQVYDKLLRPHGRPTYMLRNLSSTAVPNMDNALYFMYYANLSINNETHVTGWVISSIYESTNTTDISAIMVDAESSSSPTPDLAEGVWLEKPEAGAAIEFLHDLVAARVSLEAIPDYRALYIEVRDTDYTYGSAATVKECDEDLNYKVILGLALGLAFMTGMFIILMIAYCKHKKAKPPPPDSQNSFRPQVMFVPESAAAAFQNHVALGAVALATPPTSPGYEEKSAYTLPPYTEEPDDDLPDDLPVGGDFVYPGETLPGGNDNNSDSSSGGSGTRGQDPGDVNHNTVEDNSTLVNRGDDDEKY